MYTTQKRPDGSFLRDFGNGITAVLSADFIAAEARETAESLRELAAFAAHCGDVEGANFYEACAEEWEG